MKRVVTVLTKTNAKVETILAELGLPRKNDFVHTDAFLVIASSK